MHVFSGNDSRAVIAIEWADQESSENVDSIPLSRPIDVLDALNLRVSNNIQVLFLPAEVSCIGLPRSQSHLTWSVVFERSLYAFTEK